MATKLGSPVPRPLYRRFDSAFCTQYAELKDRANLSSELLPGTAGTLTLRSGMAGGPFWYRVYNVVPNVQREDYVCAPDDALTLEAMRQNIAAHRYMGQAISTMRKLGYQVASKEVARVLVELHNRGYFASGLCLVGTLGYMAWLNEFGVQAVSAHTLDIDVARRQQLKLAMPLDFMATMRDTGLPFAAVPGFPSTAPSTSIKLPGREGLRVDVLAPHSTLGAIVALPELAWSAQGIPYYDYLLEDTLPGAMLAGWHCVPVRLPQPTRLIWHKLYSSRKRWKTNAAKAQKDEWQAKVLASVLLSDNPDELIESAHAIPRGMRKHIREVAQKWAADEGLTADLRTLLSAVS
jgi:hypothetical protein